MSGNFSMRMLEATEPIRAGTIVRMDGFLGVKPANGVESIGVALDHALNPGDVVRVQLRGRSQVTLNVNGVDVAEKILSPRVAEMVAYARGLDDIELDGVYDFIQRTHNGVSDLERYNLETKDVDFAAQYLKLKGDL